MRDRHKVRRALISVSDKTGLAAFAQRLAAARVELVSTGGTARALREAGRDVVDVAALTEFPEMMDGRIKTLHPRIHGGLLALRDNDDHRRAMADHAIPEIDLLVANLYPFAETVKRGAGADECIANIDIGGPAMIRAAAKNHRFVGVVTDPADYDAVAGEIEREGGLAEDTKERLAAAAFAMTAAYDSAVAAWFRTRTQAEFPRHFSIAGRLAQALRYGENPHQRGALYVTGEARPGVAGARQIQGKELSYNNIGDADAAYELVCEFEADGPAVAIIKHANPCGVALGATLADAYDKAHRCDPASAFGGVVALNRRLDRAAAGRIVEIFTEAIIAPEADDDALEILSRKKNIRLLLADALCDGAQEGLMMKPVAGGFLVQSRDTESIALSNLRVVTRRAPSEAELRDMLFAFKVAKHVKSNAIVYARDMATVGVGAGQMSRLDASRIAALKAADAARACGAPAPLTQGSVVASDAFFPFADGLLAAIEAGATAVIQPGGSMRDEEVIAAADDAGAAMVFTGLRHFRH